MTASISASRFGIAFGKIKLRDKLLLLSAVIFIGFAVSIVMGIVVINKVRIGSYAYQEIKNNQQGLERIVAAYAGLARGALKDGDTSYAQQLLERARSVLPDAAE